ncbi:G-alpha-domain-containing protein [Artomyces pyxidatus]|uniref:G-alpha-domain-containing protein n=1 Tax=Artomyces pyxidatus TaxID=48021 RepID=A0ACB8SS22_9AGAM|nr:G-alpha-domain-containing protein [Artomyces pyxidatus]
MPRLRASSTADPLEAWAPPPDRSPEERAERLLREAEAQRISDAIDASLRAERASLSSKAEALKIMLLGQSESGKSTTLKNLQMTYAPAAWAAQRDSWRIVIQLNLIRSINTILDVLAEPSTPPATRRARSPLSRASSMQFHLDDDPFTGGSDDSHTPSDTSRPNAPDPHALLRLRLGPLRRVEADLQGVLGEAYSGSPKTAHRVFPELTEDRPRLREFFVRARGVHHVRHPSGVAKRGSHDVVAEAADVLAGCADDMKALWHDPSVRTVLAMSGLHLWQHAGFFLDDIDRITTRGYVPSDSDVVRARLRTVGVTEHRLMFEKDRARGSSTDEHPLTRRSREAKREWIIYDVGGCRTNRQAWLPFFEELDVIFFLAPLSCFDERLEEDPAINRLQDSVALWTAIVASPLMAKALIVLFLNKCDLLDRKLRAGSQVKDHIKGYGDRDNDKDTFVKYIKSKFKAIMVTKSPKQRPFYGYATSAIDTHAMATTLQAVREGIIRRHLEDAQLH